MATLNIVPIHASASRDMGLFKPHISGKGVQQSGAPPNGLTLNLTITLSCFKILYRHNEWESLSLLSNDYIRYNEQLIFNPSRSKYQRETQVSVSQSLADFHIKASRALHSCRSGSVGAWNRVAGELHTFASDTW